MKLYQLCLICLSFVAFGVPAHAKVATGDAPAIETSTVSGEPVSLAALRGKVVLVDFWATWCGPCVKSFGFYRDLAEKYGDQGLVVIAVSVDEDRGKVAKFLEKHVVPFLVAIDERLEIAKRFEPPTMPTAYLIDRAGKVRHIHPGFNAKQTEEFEQQVRALIAEPAPPTAPPMEGEP